MPLPQHTSVTSAELVRQFGRWQDHAASEPVLVTHHGRGRIVLLSASRYQQLIARPDCTDEAGRDQPADDKLSDLMDHVAQGFVSFSPDMTITAVNRAACGFLQTTRESVLGRQLDEQLPGIQETLGYASLKRAATSGAICTLEMPSFTYPGRWLLFETFPWRDGVACLFRDITDDMSSRREADIKGATLAALVAHGGVGRARISPRGTFTEVDHTFASFVDFAPTGLERARLTDLVVPRHKRAATDIVEIVLEGGEAQQLRVAVMTKGGEERYVQLGLAPIQNRGEAAGAMVIISAAEHGSDHEETRSG